MVFRSAQVGEVSAGSHQSDSLMWILDFVICDISLIFTMCSVSLQQDYIENKIDLAILQRCITKIYSENVPTKVAVLNSQRVRRQEMLNCLLALIHM